MSQVLREFCILSGVTREEEYANGIAQVHGQGLRSVRMRPDILGAQTCVIKKVSGREYMHLYIG